MPNSDLFFTAVESFVSNRNTAAQAVGLSGSEKSIFIAGRIILEKKIHVGIVQHVRNPQEKHLYFN